MTPEVTTLSVQSSDPPAWAIRLEAKVDVALTDHAARILAREKADAERAKVDDDHERRLRDMEALTARMVTPAALWGAVASGIGATGALAAIANAFLK